MVEIVLVHLMALLVCRTIIVKVISYSLQTLAVHLFVFGREKVTVSEPSLKVVKG